LTVVFERRSIREQELQELELIIEEKRIRMEENKTALEERKMAFLACMPQSEQFEALKRMFAPVAVPTPSLPESIDAASIESADTASTESADTASTDTASTESSDKASEAEGSNFKEDSNGPVVRAYAPDDLTTPIKEYEGLSEAVRLASKVSYSQIKVAAEGCTIYSGRRWQLVPRDMRSENIPMPERWGIRSERPA
jgi:hypothetical protein